MSSSLESMRFNLSQNNVHQGRVYLGVYPQHPESGISEFYTFYRIFFGQEYRAAFRKPKIRWQVGVMVGKCMRGECYA
jgi:hypothetical protein